MQRADIVLRKAYNKISKRFKLAFISAIMAGLIAHMYMFMNKLPNFDDLVGIDGFGTTFKTGRWFLWVVGATAYHLDFVFSLPWINGLIVLVLLGISAGIIADLLCMESDIANVLLGAILVVFPSWTGTFFYMFTAPYYALAVFMAVISVWLTVKCKWGIVPSVILLACALGIYQSYLPFTATLYVVLLFLMLFDDRYGYLDILKRSLYYLASLALGLIFYFAFLELALFITGQELSSYKGISTMGSFSLSRLPEIIKTICVNYFGIFLNNNMELSYNYITKGMYLVLLVVSAALIVMLFVRQLREKDKLKAIETLVLAAVYVIAINLIYFMCEEGIYSLMYYSYTFMMIFPLALLDRNIKLKPKGGMIAAEYVTMLVAALGIFSYCHYANAQYLSMDLSIRQAESYYTTVITQIKSLEGYSPEMKTSFIGYGNIEDESLYRNQVMEIFEMSGRDSVTAEAYSIGNFLKYYCGFDTELVGVDTESEEIQAMPVYPLEGSIKIIDDVVVVKFAEE